MPSRTSKTWPPVPSFQTRPPFSCSLSPNDNSFDHVHRVTPHGRRGRFLGPRAMVLVSSASGMTRIRVYEWLVKNMCQECSNLEAVTVDEEPESGTSGQRWVATVIARTGLSSQGDQPKSHLVLHFKTVRAIKKGEASDWFQGGTSLPRVLLACRRNCS